MSVLRVDGVVTFWSCAEWTSRDALEAGWKPAGLGGFVPAPRENIACLKDALAAVYPHHLVRPLEKRDGFAVYREKCGKEENSYERVVTAKVTDKGEVYYPMDALTYEQEIAVEGAYSKQKGLLKPDQVTAGLVKILDSLKGTRLKPSGGIYWLKQDRLAEWEAAASIVEAAACGKASKSKVYLIPHEMGPHALRAVKDALIAEVEADTARICKEIETAELGDKALARRQAQAEALMAKVEEYERILQESLPALRTLCDETTAAACSAALLDSAGVAEMAVA